MCSSTIAASASPPVSRGNSPGPPPPRGLRRRRRLRPRPGRGRSRADRLWGTSWSGGHVVYVAADDPRIAAVISQTPDLDGLRTLREVSRHANWGQLARIAWEGIKDAAGAPGGVRPHHPGRRSARPGGGDGERDAKQGYESIAGPTWRNQVSARAVLAEDLNRPINGSTESAARSWSRSPTVTRSRRLRAPAPRPGARRAGSRCASTPACTSTSTSASGASARSPTSSTSCGATSGRPRPACRPL